MTESFMCVYMMGALCNLYSRHIKLVTRERECENHESLWDSSTLKRTHVIMSDTDSEWLMPQTQFRVFLMKPVYCILVYHNLQVSK